MTHTSKPIEAEDRHEARCESDPRTRSRSHAIIANAIIWAAAILATSLILARHGVSEAVPILVTIVFVPLWFASDQLTRRL